VAIVIIIKCYCLSHDVVTWDVCMPGSFGCTRCNVSVVSGLKTARIEMHQSQLLQTNQSQQSVVVYKVSCNQSTSSPDED